MKILLYPYALKCDFFKNLHNTLPHNSPTLRNSSPASKCSDCFSLLTGPNKAILNIPIGKSLFLFPCSQEGFLEVKVLGQRLV